ncbi:hypothetical protein [Pseudoalteromonas luteoviolacea]|uniref:hypothetical protein n=1 Tax=Pseudoalteromonas luteoviolacea TaxID=43657 RepID=UPI0009BEFCF3|nr:hypothetical protein [Pseudoalteromonas luteoviolacea]
MSNADVISCATGSHTPLFDGNWITPGTHIGLIGNHHKQYRECDTRTVTQSTVFVDNRSNVLYKAGELLIPIKAGVISTYNVKAEFTALCQSNTFQRESVGTALSDFITAKLVYDLVQK